MYGRPELGNQGRTAALTGWVIYGTDPGALAEVASAVSASQDQEVLLDNLNPDTCYYYSVSGDDAEYSFKSPHVEGSARPVRVWILGDSGTGDLNATLVKLAFYDFNGRTSPDLDATSGGQCIRRRYGH